MTDYGTTNYQKGDLSENNPTSNSGKINNTKTTPQPFTSSMSN